MASKILFVLGGDIAYLCSNRTRHASCLTTSEPGRDFFIPMEARRYSNDATSTE